MSEIVAGSIVDWSEKGRRAIKHYYERGLPRRGPFRVERVVFWPKAETSVRLEHLTGAVLISWVEPVSLVHEAGTD